ncbi:hypothetical protein D3C72_1486860 [compost metagenome]
MARGEFFRAAHVDDDGLATVDQLRDFQHGRALAAHRQQWPEEGAAGNNDDGKQKNVVDNEFHVGSNGLSQSAHYKIEAGRGLFTFCFFDLNPLRR